MVVENFLQLITELNNPFCVGIPDSLLKPLCDYLLDTYGVSDEHVIAANEGNAVAIATGYHLATGKIPVVYLQNSGLGNIVNPVASLLNNKVYGIPCIFIIGWRGEPGVNDEPQHIYQGEITEQLLVDLDIAVKIISKDTTECDLKSAMDDFEPLLKSGKSIAFLVRKGALSYEKGKSISEKPGMLRENIIEKIVKVSKEDIIVSTTGKTSRELFEVREKNGQSNKYDFLTVGSMGHSSSIALGIAINKPRTRVWCIDGDGAALMHMGSMALIGASSLSNYIHVVINNGAHESVGGQPTVAKKIDFCKVAEGCGYKSIHRASEPAELDEVLSLVSCSDGPVFIEIKSAIGSRENLGRPTSSPIENKEMFMDYLKECK